jgi:hypothetical protein
MQKTKKKTIPKSLKIAVWNKYIGEDIGKAKCLCCNLTDITQLKFHTGHVIAEANGGESNIDNLRPICETTFIKFILINFIKVLILKIKNIKYFLFLMKLVINLWELKIWKNLKN